MSGCSQFEKEAPAGIILISIDSLRADHLHCYGYPVVTSPNIDRIADEGILFQRTIAQAPWTLPSHLSMLTSRFVKSHGVDEGNKKLNAETVTLAEVLQQEGYATAAFVSGPWMHPQFGFARGFDFYNMESGSADAIRSHSDITSPAITARVMEWLNHFDRKRNFFLFIHYWDVHYDYIPPSPYDRIFDPDYTGNVDGKNFETDPGVNHELPEEDIRHLLALYDGEIAFTDKYIGMLFQRLIQLDLFDESLIIITSDHGDEFFEHKGKGHCTTLYDEVIRVPLIIRPPRGKDKTKIIPATARSIDIAATVLKFAGCTIPDSFQGKNLPAVNPSHSTENVCYPAFSETSVVRRGPDGRPVMFEEDGHKLLVEQNLLKLIRENPGNTRELYSIAGNPRETKNLLQDKPELNSLFADTINYYEKGLKGESDLEAVSLDEETQDQLKALGYIE